MGMGYHLVQQMPAAQLELQDVRYNFAKKDLRYNISITRETHTNISI